jgi:hypothetical protein
VEAQLKKAGFRLPLANELTIQTYHRATAH